MASTAVTCLQVERAKLEKAVEEELAAEAAADEAAKQQKREQIAAEERRLQELEEQRQAEVSNWGFLVGIKGFGVLCHTAPAASVCTRCVCGLRLRLSGPGPLLACWAGLLALRPRGGCDWIVCRVCCCCCYCHACRSLLLLLRVRRRSGGGMRRTSRSCRRSWRQRRRRSEGRVLHVCWGMGDVTQPSRVQGRGVERSLHTTAAGERVSQLLV